MRDVWCLVRRVMGEACARGAVDEAICDVLWEEMARFEDPGDGKRLLGYTHYLVDTGDGGVADAFYVEGETGEGPVVVLVVSTWILGWREYAAYTILHELAHHLGLEEEDFADAIAVYLAPRLHQKYLEAEPEIDKIHDQARKKECIAPIQQLLKGGKIHIVGGIRCR